MQATYHRCPSPNVSLKGAEKPHPSRADSQTNSVHALRGDRNSGTFSATIRRGESCQARDFPPKLIDKHTRTYLHEGPPTTVNTFGSLLRELCDTIPQPPQKEVLRMFYDIISAYLSITPILLAYGHLAQSLFIRYNPNIQTNSGACPTMTLNLDIHKCAVMLSQFWRSEKFPP